VTGRVVVVLALLAALVGCAFGEPRGQVSDRYVRPDDGRPHICITPRGKRERCYPTSADVHVRCSPGRSYPRCKGQRPDPPFDGDDQPPPASDPPVPGGSGSPASPGDPSG
jgi:hypothetical protein